MRKLPKALDHTPISHCLPEHNLWLATLIDGIYSALHHKNSKDQYWLLSDKIKTGSSSWICQHCNIDKDALIQKLKNPDALLPPSAQPQRTIQFFFKENKPLWKRTKNKPSLFNDKLPLKSERKIKLRRLKKKI